MRTSRLPIILTVTNVELARDFNEIFDSQPPPTVTITFQAPRKFRYERLLQVMDKRVEIRILEEETCKRKENHE